jgi:gluconate 2-dehydrogenase gamma chain
MKQTKKNFAAQDSATRDSILGKIEAGELHFDDVPAKAFFSLLLQNTREGFFCDPIHGGNKELVGWKQIGFPGARADFMDWVERNEPYPIPPVSIRGERA